MRIQYPSRFILENALTYQGPSKPPLFERGHADRDGKRGYKGIREPGNTKSEGKYFVFLKEEMYIIRTLGCGRPSGDIKFS
jgi:hypothetical protein